MPIIPTKNENIRMNYIWRGYENSKDITNSNKQTLTEGSLNVLINDNEKIIPRGGSLHFPYNIFSDLEPDDTGIIGEFEHFYDIKGQQLPVRISYGQVFDTLWVYTKDATGEPNWLMVDIIQVKNGRQKYTFTTWFNEDQKQDYLIFCNGSGSINMWTGANVNTVTSTAPNTLTISSGTWQENGFNTAETLSIRINGTYYTITSPGTLNTNTVTVSPNPFGVVTGQSIAFNSIVTITPPSTNPAQAFSFDYCAQLYNQVYYGDFRSRRLLISNNRNQQSSIGLPTFFNVNGTSSGLDDATFSGTYTGLTNSEYKVVINSAGVNSYTFTSNGSGIDDASVSFTGGAYFGLGDNTYRIWLDITGLTAYFYKNDVFDSFQSLSPGVNILGVDSLNISIDTNNHVDGDTWVFKLFGEDTINVYKDGSIILQNFTIPAINTATTPIPLSDGVEVTFQSFNGHAVGDTWVINAKREITRAYSNFYYNTPGRTPGQGFEILLDSPFFTMHPQEKDMYIYCSAGHQYNVYPKLSADLRNETIIVSPLKHDPENIPQDSWLIGIFKNNLATVTRDNTVEIIGRQRMVELPQIRVMSDNIKKDLNTLDWRDGDIKYIKRKLYITLPRENLMFVWNDARGHWQPPQRFARRIGLLSQIDGKVIGHDFDSNNSYELFVEGELNDIPTIANKQGVPIRKKIVLPYNNRGERMKLKKSYAIGFEGYIIGVPEIEYTINFDINNCIQPFKNKINPIFCWNDKASLGKGNLGYHGLGNDPINEKRKFRDIYEFPEQIYFESNIELESNGISEYWEILGLGMNELNSKLNNTCITSNQVINV